MSQLLQLLLALSAILVAAKLAGSLSRRLGLPSVFGELLVGVILGPTALNLFGRFPAGHGLEESIKELSELGVILLMFLAGLETDLKALRRVRGAALLAAFGGAALPFVAGTSATLLLGFPVREAVFIGTVITATSVSITAETLMELGRMRSKEGATILGAAVIDDVIGVTLVSAVVALSGQPGSAAGAGAVAQVAGIIFRMGAFLTVALLAGRMVPPLLNWVAKRLKSAESLTAVALGLVLFYAWGAEYFGGLAAITGAYLLGVIISRTELAGRIESKMRIPAYALLVPVFFVNIGMQVDARQLLGTSLGATLIVVGVAILTKIAGAGLGALTARFQWREALRVGVGMVSRGEVALVIAAAGLQARVLGESSFSVVVAMTLVTTLVTPPLLRLVFDRKVTEGGEGTGDSEPTEGADGSEGRHRHLECSPEMA